MTMLGSKISEASLRVVTPSGGLKKRITLAFPRSVQKQTTGLAWGKDKFFTDKLYSWVMTSHHDLSS